MKAATPREEDQTQDLNPEGSYYIVNIYFDFSCVYNLPFAKIKQTFEICKFISKKDRIIQQNYPTR